MKRNLILVGLALGAAVTLGGCSQSSPTAPKQPTPSTYGISLIVSPNVAGINESITVVAMVTVGGASAPDGTPVTFNATGVAQFVGGSRPQQVVATTVGGRAVVTVTATSGGAGLITATVPNKQASAQVNFLGVSATQLAIVSVLPNRGKPQGGDQVVVSGQGFVQPLTLRFIVAGTAYTATVVSVAADGSSITALTPQVPSSSGDQLASIQVTLTGVVAPGGGTLSATLANAFTYGADTGVPQLYSVVPNSGSSNGGDIITLTGKYFTEPLQVSFVFAAATVPGQVTSVQHGADGVDVAQVVTPKVTIAGRTTVNITITNMAGTASSKTATFNQVFTFNPPVTGPPVIYYISPAYGSVAGNDTVTIFGANFAAPASVTIGPTSEIVQSISGDGTSITILTRAVGGVVPTDPQDVTVTTAQGTVTLSKAFSYIEGQTPTLYVLTPNIGPVEGGTRVTITGTGFQYPVQVLFGTQQAQIVSNNFNQVVCISPSITPSQPGSTPTTVQVSVTNVGSGKVSNALPFQYGQAMFISGITPAQAPADATTTVTITGQGFVGPVSVTTNIASVPSWTVLSVAGTQIVAQALPIPASARSCGDVTATITVTNLDSNLKSNPGTFTYSAVRPLISSVQIDGGGNTVTQYAPPTCGTSWSAHMVTIKGSGFVGPTMNVTFVGSNGGTVGPVLGTVVDANTITLTLADLSGIAIKQITCTPGGGGCGQQSVPTAVGVTVASLTNGCSDTLGNAIVINPCVTTCVPSSITSLSLSNPGSPQTVGTPFLVTATISPAQTQGTSITLTCNPAFNCPAVTIPATLTTYPISIMPLTAVSNGQIFATSGSGACQVASNVLSVSAQASLAVTLVLNGGATGSITSNPPGITLSTATTQTLNFSLSPVFLTANVTLGSFGGWGGDCSTCGTTAANCSVPMNSGTKSCTATFNNP